MAYGYLAHHGVQGQKWGVRRYQNADGSLTAAGRQRYGMIKNKNVSYIGGQHGYINAYKKDKNKFLKDIKGEIKSDETLTKKEKRQYYKNSKKVVDDFLNDKYDMKVSQMANRYTGFKASRRVVAGIAGIPILVAKKGTKVSKRSKSLYRLEKDRETGINTLYNNKNNRVIATSDKKSKSKKKYKKVSQAIEDKEYLRTLYPKDKDTYNKIWIEPFSRSNSIKGSNKQFLENQAKEREKKKKQIKETYFNV